MTAQFTGYFDGNWSFTITKIERVDTLFIIVGLLLAGTIIGVLNAVGGFMVWKEKN